MTLTARRLNIILVAALVLWAQRLVAVAGEVPGDPGDLIFRTHDGFFCQAISNFTGSPCHVGIYVGEVDGVDTVVEAVLELWDGVIKTPLDDFRSYNDAVINGARTTSPIPTSAQRRMIVAYVLTKSERCTRYDVLHNNQKCGEVDLCFGSDAFDFCSEFDCVGLAERAYEEAGLDPMPASVEGALLTPHNQFLSTHDAVLPPCRFIPGQAAVFPSEFDDGYQRNGGKAPVGCAQNSTHTWGPGVIQDFDAGSGGRGALMRSSGGSVAYWIHGAIWQKYLQEGGADGHLGYPRSDESEGLASALSGARSRYTQLTGGAIEHHASGPLAGRTVWLGHGIRDKWSLSGYGRGPLGLPIGDEAPVQSGALATTAALADFEGGHIYWHASGDRAGQAFAIHGAPAAFFDASGGHAGPLGFPVSDVEGSGDLRVLLEGGTIVCPNGSSCRLAECTTAADCGPTAPCEQALCASGICSVRTVPDGSVCAQGYCSSGVCGACSMNVHCADSEACTEDLCNSGVCLHRAVQDGTLCGSGVCTQGACGPAAHAIQVTIPAFGSPNPVAPSATAALSVAAIDTLGHALSYAWGIQCPTLPSAGTLLGSATKSPSWLAPQNDGTNLQECDITVTISDGQISVQSSYRHGVLPGGIGSLAIVDGLRFAESPPYVVEQSPTVDATIRNAGSTTVVLDRVQAVGTFQDLVFQGIYTRDWPATQFDPPLSLGPGATYRYVRQLADRLPVDPSFATVRLYAKLNSVGGQKPIASAVDGGVAQLLVTVGGGRITQLAVASGVTFAESPPYLINDRVTARAVIRNVSASTVVLDRVQATASFQDPFGFTYERTWPAIEFMPGLFLGPGATFAYERQMAEQLPALPSTGRLSVAVKFSRLAGQEAVTAAEPGASPQLVFSVEEPLHCTDGDGDGYAREGGACGAADCRDDEALVNPGAIETCNGTDDDCDGEIDEDVQQLLCEDRDGDGFGGVDSVRLACPGSPGLTVACEDCDDQRPDIHPGAIEICDNGEDDDCQGGVDCADVAACVRDVDGDGSYAAPCGTDCNDGDSARAPTIPEVCGDLVDNDCDGYTDCRDEDCRSVPQCVATATPNATETPTPTATVTPTLTQTPTPSETATPNPCPSAHCLNCSEFCDCEDARPGACIGSCVSGAPCVNLGGACACLEAPTRTPTPSLTGPPTPCPTNGVTLHVGNTAAMEPEFCVDVDLSNPNTAVRAVQGSLVDIPDEFELVGSACTDRTSGFSCSTNETLANQITFVVVDLAGRCIDMGSGSILRVCLHDKEPMCPASSLVSLDPEEVLVADCAAQALDVCTQSGQIVCDVLGDCAPSHDGNLDIFDVLYKIDIVLRRVTSTPTEEVLCDDDCDGDINIFDVLREIDAILGRIPQPLTCPSSFTAAFIPATAAPTVVEEAPSAATVEGTRMSSRTKARVSLRERGRAVMLANRTPLRGIELTLTPEGGPARVVGIQATARSHGFVVDYYQASPTAPVKVVLVSLAGETLHPGRGAIVSFDLGPGRHRGRLRLTDVQVAE